jgi:hypothetical protein
MVNFRKLFTRKKKNSWKNRPNLPAGSAYNLTFKPPVVNMSRIVGISGPEKKKWWHRFTRKAAQPRNESLEMFGYYDKPRSLKKGSSNKNLLTFSPKRNEFLENIGFYNKPTPQKVSNNENLLTFPSKRPALKYPFEYPAANSNTETERHFKFMFEQFMDTLQEFAHDPKNKELERLALEFARELPRIRPLTARELELIEETGKAAKRV